MVNRKNRRNDMSRCDYVIKVDNEYPSTNDIIRSSKSHVLAYGAMKDKYVDITRKAIREQLKTPDNAGTFPLARVEVVFVWYEVRKFARDPDNIQGGDKFIMDALVKEGIIEDDSLNEVAGIRNHFVLIDANNVSDRKVAIGIKGVE